MARKSGSGKTCEKGRACGNSCVSSGYECRKQLTAAANEVLKKLREEAQAERPKAEPEKLEEYDIERIIEDGELLGHGSYGEAFVDKDVVVKRILYGSDAEVAGEVRITKMMGELGVGPKVLSDIVIGETDIREEQRKTWAFAMERVKGETLDSWSRNRATFDKDVKKNSKQISKVLRSLSDQIRKLHDKGYVHGDLHDHNVIVDPETGNVTLIDFGEAWKTTSRKYRLNDIEGVYHLMQTLKAVDVAIPEDIESWAMGIWEG